jgi:hypothetical protein
MMILQSGEIELPRAAMGRLDASSPPWSPLLFRPAVVFRPIGGVRLDDKDKDKPPSAKDPTNVNAQPGQKTAVSPPATPKEVVVAPDLSTRPSDPLSVWYWLLWGWSDKWQQQQTTTRVRKVVTPLAARTASRTADLQTLSDRIKAAYKDAWTASQGGLIHHAIGHGDGKSLSPDFDLGCQLGGLSTHVLTISNDVFELHDRLQAGQTSFVKRNGQPFTQAEIDELKAKYTLMEDLGKIITAKPSITGLTIVTCNIGKRADFLQRIANVLGVCVTAYDDPVGITEKSGDFKIGIDPKEDGNFTEGPAYELPATKRTTKCKQAPPDPNDPLGGM